jgi:CMP-N-acetylneuraminic acid synthetase
MPLGGLPLLGWTIRTAQEAACFERIIVSTDDMEIADLAGQYGAEAPWLRSPALATDQAGVIDTVLEVLGRIEQDGAPRPGAVMLLQPTSPFRSVNSIRSAIKQFRDLDGESVVSVSKATTHPYWCRSIDERGALQPFCPGNVSTARFQDLPAAYQLNGLIYLAATDTLLREKSFYGARTQALVIESDYEALDIDTALDFALAQTLLRQLQLAAPIFNF